MEESKQVKHIAIIMDGNRRFAQKQGLDKVRGHDSGAKKLGEVIEWCLEYRIKELTLYTFSMQNFSREKREVDTLLNLFRKHFEKLKDDNKISKNRIRVRVIGRIHMFPEDLQRSIYEIMEKTKTHDNLTINFAMAYGGREEIVDAVRKIAEDVKFGSINITNIDSIDEKMFASKLYLNSDPEIVIRTGGDKRTSNFLPWQTIYSEWFFTTSLWPEFSKEEFVKILDEFNSRERRFGK
jgi:tritrans,polycis-undecaprenyl-diphosphate synthase [geranylgeranyl-diphosphate specific]